MYCRSRIIPSQLANIINYTARLSSSGTTKLPQREWIKPEGYDTGIKIYNCITKSTVPLILQNSSNYATWYTCGPTVYDSAHIGHASCYVKLDILKRILKNYFKVNLITAMNITDIDDKIINKSKELGMDWRVLSKNYELEFWNDMEMLDVEEPDFIIRVSDNIADIIKFIDKLIQSGVAYQAVADKSVYFEINKYKNYGKLQKINLSERLIFELESNVKKSQHDFALWKAVTSDKEPHFKSPWGNGRPGWHIECSSMASAIFGNKIDFHCGGLDLKFPHHENEEAQSCAYHKCDQWVNYWIHTGHLNLTGDAEKMSKSLKNTISINEMLDLFSPETFRMLCILSNYRSGVEFSAESMNNADNILKKFISFFADANAYTEGDKPKVNYDSNLIYDKMNEIEKRIDTHLKDDFDTAKSVGCLSELTSFTLKIINNSDAKNLNLPELTPSSVQAVSNFTYDYLHKYFGLNLVKNLETADGVINNSIDVHGIISSVLKIRSDIRDSATKTKNKDLFAVCDNIRDCLKENGIEVKDHGKSSSWNINK